MKALLLLFSCFLSIASSLAQDRPIAEKTLLWRISGKTLVKPSYLYGTLHLADEKLFNFSDSLLEAIKNAEGFATEVEPDEMMVVLMEDMFNDIKKTKMLKDVVSAKAYKKYAPMLARRLKKPQDAITVKDVIKEENKWMNDAYKKGAMPTFVDMWLYDLARKQGKVVGGIEDIEDQMGLIENLFTEQDLEFLTSDYSKEGKIRLQEMMNLYVDQDLASIDRLTNQYSAEQKDALLLKRNVKMAKRMDSLSALRTMVFAVGAAHLPGDSGVINILRKKGFDVSPVYGSKKVAGKSYKVDAKPVAWTKFKEKDGLYEVEMPGKANAVKMMGVLEMRMNIDLFNSSGYITMVVPSSVGESNPDSILLTMGRRMLNDKKLKQGKPLELNGIKGREFTGFSDDSYKRAQIFVNDKSVYMACAFFTKEGELNSENANRFFTSFTIARLADVAEKWLPFKDVVPGIEAMAPAKLERNKQMEGQVKEPGWQSNAYTALDANSGLFYMLITKTSLNDTYIPNDSVFLNSIRANTVGKAERMDEDIIANEGGKFSLYQKGIYKDNKLQFQLKSVVQGNRFTTYVVLAEDKPKNIPIAEKAARSLTASKPPATQWGMFQQADKPFKTWAHAPIIKYIDASSDSLVSYNSRDTNTSYVFTILPVALDTTKWYASKKQFWDETVELGSDGDSVIYKHYFTNNDVEGCDAVKTIKDNPYKIERRRWMLYGDTLYSLFAAVPIADSGNSNVLRFFNDFSFNKAVPPATIFTSKAASFIGLLQHGDSAAASPLFNKIADASFNSADIPLLRNAMLYHYDWDSSFYTPVQTKIGEKLLDIGDSSLGDFLMENYAKPGKRQDVEQSVLLRHILMNSSKEKLAFVLKALSELGDTTEISNSVIYMLDDSVALTKKMVPELLHLLLKPNMIDATLDVVKRLVDSGVVKPVELLPFEKAILAFGDKQLEIQNEEDGYSEAYLLESIAAVAGDLNTTGSIKYLEKLLLDKQNSVKTQGVVGLLRAGAPLPQGVIAKLASDVSQRIYLYDNLKQVNKLSLFPAAMLNQQQFAQSAVYDYLVEDEEITDGSALMYVDKLTTSIAGKTANVFFFRFKSGKDSYLAAVAFPPEENKLEPLDMGVVVYWDEAFSQKLKDAQVASLVKQLGEE